MVEEGSQLEPVGVCPMCIRCLKCVTGNITSESHNAGNRSHTTVRDLDSISRKKNSGGITHGHP